MRTVWTEQRAIAVALKQLLPPRFIELWINAFHDANTLFAERITAVRTAHDVMHATAMKLVSYYGAIDVPDWVPDTCASYYCEVTRSLYMDPGNYCYAEVFRLLWPAAAAGHNDEYLGDVIESILAWQWWYRVVSHRQIAASVADVLELLQRLVLWTWCKHNFSRI